MQSAELLKHYTRRVESITSDCSEAALTLN